MKKDIIVKIKDGKVTIDVLGVHGSSCEDLAQKLSSALGNVVKTDIKPEYTVELDDLSIKQFIE